MKSIGIIFKITMLLVASSLLVNGQNGIQDDKVYYEVEEMPVYPGGEDGLREFIAENVQYPENAKKNGITGKVFVSFVVDKTGKVTNVEIARSVDDDLDKEALRVIKTMQTWKPGKIDGKKVNVGFTIPIMFALCDSKDE